MSAFHPNLKLPLWAAVAIAAAAYVYRSVSRGFDFRPDLPLDGLVFALFVALLAIVYFGRRARAQYEAEEDEREEDEREHEGA